MSENLETLRRVGQGICERRPVRVRVGAAVWDRIYRGLCESEYEVAAKDGGKVYMWMRWCRPDIHVPHYLVFNTPVELHPEMSAEEIAYDHRESM